MVTVRVGAFGGASESVCMCEEVRKGERQKKRLEEGEGECRSKSKSKQMILFVNCDLLRL